MSKLKILSVRNIDENKEEFLPFFLGASEQEAEENFFRFAKMLHGISAAYAKNTGLEKEDLFGTGLIGLARALRDFDSSRSDNFYMYANYRIRSAINDYCRKNITVVSIPHYIIVAHGYITRIRNIVLKYTDEIHDMQELLSKKKNLDDLEIPLKEKSLCRSYMSQLQKLAKSSGVSYMELISRAEYIPLNVSFEEDYLTSDDLEKRDLEQIQITTFVSHLMSGLTAKEKQIAYGIMMGKTYEEIGEEQKPPRSAAWVKKQLEKMKKRIQEEMEWQ